MLNKLKTNTPEFRYFLPPGGWEMKIKILNIQLLDFKKEFLFSPYRQVGGGELIKHNTSILPLPLLPPNYIFNTILYLNKHLIIINN